MLEILTEGVNILRKFQKGSDCKTKEKPFFFFRLKTNLSGAFLFSVPIGNRKFSSITSIIFHAKKTVKAVRKVITTILRKKQRTCLNVRLPKRILDTLHLQGLLSKSMIQTFNKTRCVS